MVSGRYRCVSFSVSSLQHILEIAKDHTYCCEFSGISAVMYLSLVNSFGTKSRLKVYGFCPLTVAKLLLPFYPKCRVIVNAQPHLGDVP